MRDGPFVPFWNKTPPQYILRIPRHVLSGITVIKKHGEEKM